MSRSSTCVLAYLMLKKDMTAIQALQEVRRYREVKPNDGFLRQLADLDNKLKKEREKKLSEKNVKEKSETTCADTKLNSTISSTTSCLSSGGNKHTNGRKIVQTVTWK